MPKGRFTISTTGGQCPLWSPYSRELFYRNGDAVFAVPVKTGSGFDAGKAELLFRGTYYSPTRLIEYAAWDIHPDGRFLMLKASTKPETEINAEPSTRYPLQVNVVLNWDEELKEKAPAK